MECYWQLFSVFERESDETDAKDWWEHWGAGNLFLLVEPFRLNQADFIHFKSLQVYVIVSL